MEMYHKINSIYKRDTKGQFLTGQWSVPEFGYLADNLWRGTEKIDGTNVRIAATVDDDEELSLQFGGRTENAQMPLTLVQKLEDTFRTGDMAVKLIETFGQGSNEPIDVMLFGEGYGAKIQKGGGNYIPDGVDFILFDVKVGGWWLLPDDVRDVGEKLGLRVVPDLGTMTLNQWIGIVKHEMLASAWPIVEPEGVVLVPSVPLFDRRGHRIITKVKGKDFK